jgi:hypothetical protein
MQWQPCQLPEGQEIGVTPQLIRSNLQGEEWNYVICVASLKEQLTGPRQPRAAAGTDEQLFAQVFFQFFDSAREWRLLDMQLLRCAGKVEFLRNGNGSMPNVALVALASTSVF